MAKKKITIEQITMAETQLQTMQRQVDYDTKDYTVELLLSKFERGDFFIPDYQRQYVWKANNRSLFIESVLLDFLYHLCSLRDVMMDDSKSLTVPKECKH